MINFKESSFSKHSDKSAIAETFSSAASTYDAAALLQREVGHRLIERWDCIKTLPHTNTESLIGSEIPKTVLDLGCGTGFSNSLVRSRFPKVHIINLDLSFRMLEVFRQIRSPSKGFDSFVCADVEQLPISHQSFELVFSNCTLQWCINYLKLFSNIHEVLKQSGIFLFSTFGPDTLYELKECFKTLDNHPHINQFSDMHLLGDALLHAGFSNPVVEREVITLQFPSVMHLFQDLKSMGANYVYRDKPIGLMTRRMFNKIIQNYENFRNDEDLYPASFEVIYGFATKKPSREKKCISKG